MTGAFLWQHSFVRVELRTGRAPVPPGVVGLPSGCRVSSGPLGAWHIVGMRGVGAPGMVSVCYRRLLIREGAELPDLPDGALVLLDLLMGGAG